MIILGIETSCDDTGVALYSGEKGVLAHQMSSQLCHQAYGGVVPELASRDHVRSLLPLVDAALLQANLVRGCIDGIAYTAGPGLVGSLLVGASLAKALSYGWQLPAIAIHHMEAHLVSAFLDKPGVTFPFVGLLVSGGHTLLVKVTALGCYEIIGATLDDAVGEAFDKSAKLMGLPYPGGPILSKLAQEGDPCAFDLPRPLWHQKGGDMSFSGLKTAVRHAWQKSDQTEQVRRDMAASFQQAVVDVLVKRCAQAMEATQQLHLVVAGGVSANTALREQLQAMVDDRGGELTYPDPAYCTDNGAMVAYAGYLRFIRGYGDCNLDFAVKARWSLETLK